MTAEDALKTGTTTIGIKLKDGVILASDQRATMGNLIAHSHVQKVYQLADNIGMTIAGVVGDAQLMVRFMQSEISIYSMKKGAPMSVTAAATLVASVIRQGFYLGLIVGGYDKTGGHVFSIDGAGGYIEDNYMSVGSGSGGHVQGRGHRRRDRRPQLRQEEGQLHRRRDARLLHRARRLRGDPRRRDQVKMRGHGLRVPELSSVHQTPSKRFPF